MVESEVGFVRRCRIVPATANSRPQAAGRGRLLSGSPSRLRSAEAEALLRLLAAHLLTELEEALLRARLPGAGQSPTNSL
jgi:hypothetical protein